MLKHMNIVLFIQEDFVLINTRSEFIMDHSYAYWHDRVEILFLFTLETLLVCVCSHVFFFNQRIMISHNLYWFGLLPSQMSNSVRFF